MAAFKQTGPYRMFAKGRWKRGTGAIRFDTTQHVTGVLWFTFTSADTSFYDGSEQLVLNDETYSQVRNAVVEKLGANAKTYISNIEI